MPVFVTDQEPAVSHPRHFGRRGKHTIISVKAIPTIHTSGLLCGFEQQSVPSQRVEIEPGGRNDDVKDDRYD